MIEINVVKKASYTWWWLLIVLLALAAVYFLGASDTGTRSVIYGSGSPAPAVAALTLI